MSLKIHVYIATSKGLVALQNITDLQDKALQSVITINGSTDLASISPNYHRFVQKSTGLVHADFGGDSFRANISRNIDQGNSWQLPFYIAHFIQSNNHADCQLGQGIVKTSDVVLIATGQINTSNGQIESVEQVAEKCITASAQIKLWMKAGVLVEFFVPAKNFLAHLPALECAVYPVINTHQIKEHVDQLLPLTAANKRIDTAAVDNVFIEDDSATGANRTLFDVVNQGIEQAANVTRISRLGMLSRVSHRIINAKSKQGFTSKALVIPMLILLIVAVTIWGSILTFPNEKMRYLTSSKSSLYCDANVIEQNTPIANQYVSRVPSLTFEQTCNMTLITSIKVPQVWLVADSKTLIELENKEIDNELHWLIPPPKQQHIDREFILIITNEYLDLSDLAAFKTYLSRLDRAQKPSVELLAKFFSQIDINPQYVSQKLVAANR